MFTVLIEGGCMKYSMKKLFRMMNMAITPNSKLLKSKLSNGAVVYGKNCAGFGGRGIYIMRDSIEPEFQFLEKFLDPQGVFIDIGANTGIYCVKAAKHYKNDGVVLAVEPFIDILSTLQYSIQINGFSNVRLRNFCVSNHTGMMKFWRNFEKPNCFSLTKYDPNAKPLSVLTVSLDDLFSWENLDRLDYLKIDAEGAEQDILFGAKNVIQKHRPIIQLEITFEEIHTQLFNYSVFYAPLSPNKICIPNEHSKIGVPKQLGWKQMAN
jgi:FkbM family methyltransferase